VISINLPPIFLKTSQKPTFYVDFATKSLNHGEARFQEKRFAKKEKERRESLLMDED